MTHVRIILLFAILLGSYVSNAHSKTEIGLRFIEENEKTFMEVHLTSLTLFDLIYELYPYLKSKESLNLSSYLSDYEIYFNEKLDIRLNGEGYRLGYIDSNLITHDATIKFLIKDFDEKIEKYELTVGGFDFYQKPIFAVLFTTTSITASHFLTTSNNKCSGSNSELLSKSNGESQMYAYGLVAIIASLIVFKLILIGRKRKFLRLTSTF